ncbi:MAG TPA: FTR1 family protein [Solirubrobacteraceae bacterium]|jgi:high-affinity iron transporter
MRRLALGALLCLLLSQALGVSVALAAPAAPILPQRQLDGTSAMLELLAADYRAADPTHEVSGAARVRTLALALERQLASWQSSRAQPTLALALAQAQKLRRALAATSERLQPWPLPLDVKASVALMQADLQRAGLRGSAQARPYKAIDALFADAQAAGAAGAMPGVSTAYAAEAFALFAAGPDKRLGAVDSALAASVDDAFWRSDSHERGLLVVLAEGAGASASAVRHAAGRASEGVETTATVLGDRTIGKDTVVADAAVIVFREGLEAVLILAAITASFVGERRKLRRPVLLGALLGLGATAVTYVLAQVLVDALGDGGLRLQAITGVIAIAVLLLVTNWFFHRVYWSEWLGRFHRRRRAIERFDRLGFLSGQVVGFALLGLTSVYREGFETVLFLQNLQVSAGSQATALGIAIGLAGTLAVGFVTFKLERKLPYKKMLIATGVLIGLVLAVMVGTTVHSLQGLGWAPNTPTGFQLELWWGQWLGVYATWEGIGAQLLALLVVYGSYALARALQMRRYKRAPGPELPTLARG